MRAWLLINQASVLHGEKGYGTLSHRGKLGLRATRTQYYSKAEKYTLQLLRMSTVDIRLSDGTTDHLSSPTENCSLGAEGSNLANYKWYLSRKETN